MKAETNSARLNGNARAEAAAGAAQDAAEDIVESARSALDTIAGAARDRVEQVREEIVDRTNSAATKLRALAQEDLADTAPGRAVAEAARRVGNVAEGLKGQNLRNAARSSAAFARRNPEIVVAGMAVVGFLLTRALRASVSEPAPIAKRKTRTATPRVEAAAPAPRKVGKPRAKKATA